MDASDPKWVNSILNIVAVNSIWLKNLHIYIEIQKHLISEVHMLEIYELNCIVIYGNFILYSMLSIAILINCYYYYNRIKSKLLYNIHCTVAAK